MQKAAPVDRVPAAARLLQHTCCSQPENGIFVTTAQIQENSSFENSVKRAENVFEAKRVYTANVPKKHKNNDRKLFHKSIDFSKKEAAAVLQLPFPYAKSCRKHCIALGFVVYCISLKEVW